MQFTFKAPIQNNFHLNELYKTDTIHNQEYLLKPV